MTTPSAVGHLVGGACADGWVGVVEFGAGMDMVWAWAVAAKKSVAAREKQATRGCILSSWSFRIEDSFLFAIRKANEEVRRSHGFQRRPSSTPPMFFMRSQCAFIE
jgi:hypothetical protein